REWRMMLGGAFCLAAIALLMQEGYRVFYYGVTRPVPGLPSLYRLTCTLMSDMSCLRIPRAGIYWSAHPVLFIANLTILLSSMAIVTGLVALVFWGGRPEQRIWDRRVSRPPMDTAIREPTAR